MRRRSLRGVLTVTACLALASLVHARTAPAAEATSGRSLEEVRQRVIELVNAERARVGCRPLRSDSRLTRSAQRHSEHMARTDTLTHEDPRGDLLERTRAAGYGASAAAENVAAGYDSPEAAVAGWLASPGHRRNMLDCGLQDTGVGVIYGFDGRLYWTQQFAAA